MNAQESVQIVKNTYAVIRVERREFKDREFIDIRQYYLDDDKNWKPTPKGVTMPPDAVGELINALKNFVEVD